MSIINKMTPFEESRHLMIMNLISDIRNSHSKMVDIYTRGGCYSFFKILKGQFGESVGYMKGDHVITKIGWTYYDITGVVDGEGSIELLEIHTEQGLESIFKDSELKLTEQ